MAAERSPFPPPMSSSESRRLPATIVVAVAFPVAAFPADLGRQSVETLVEVGALTIRQAVVAIAGLQTRDLVELPDQAAPFRTRDLAVGHAALNAPLKLRLTL